MMCGHVSKTGNNLCPHNYKDSTHFFCECAYPVLVLLIPFLKCILFYHCRVDHTYSFAVIFFSTHTLTFVLSWFVDRDNCILHSILNPVYFICVILHYDDSSISHHH